ncbi:MAG: RNA polymerase sigma factor [Patescibacteria group bacterium]|nr:RNA polymerase sigma factor [Patescibacteria group bacterium]
MSRISMDLEKEEKLVKKAQRGGRAGQKAFEDIYAHYQPHITTFFKAQLGQNRETEDLVQETFTKALKGLDSFQWQGVSLSAWLYRIARNVLIDYFREKEKRESTSLEKIAPPVSKEETPPTSYIKEEKTQLLQNLINQLPRREQEIIYLKFFEGRRNKDIANMMNLSETNVGTIVHRCMKKLRKKIKEQETPLQETKD